MKLAFVSQPIDWVIPPLQSSIGIWTNQVASRLAPSHDVSVFLRRMGSQHTSTDCRIDFRFVRTIPNRLFWERAQAFPWPFTRPKRPFFSTAFYYADYALQTAIALRRGAYDIIHIQNSPQFVPIIRAVNPEAKIALHMHCEWLSQLDRELVGKRLRSVDLIIGCSNHITEEIRRAFPQMASRCHTVFNGVDSTCFSPQNEVRKRDVPHILFVGRISPEKGVHILLDAFTLIRKRFPDAQLSLVGPVGSAPLEFLVALSDTPAVAQLAKFYHGAYRDHLQAQIPSDAQANVVFTGSVPQNSLAHHYNHADVLVNPSFSESFGMSLVEAMACARPVVASRVGGMIDIVQDGLSGSLVEPGNPDQLANAIIQILSDPQRSRAMGQAGRMRVEDSFSWDRITADLLERYQELLQ